MIVAEYEAKFIELSHFAPMFVADERKKCRLFQDGLSWQSRQRLEFITITILKNYFREPSGLRRLKKNFIVICRIEVKGVCRVSLWVQEEPSQ